MLGLLSLPMPWLFIEFEGQFATGSAFDLFDLLSIMGQATAVEPGLAVAILLMVIGMLLVIIDRPVIKNRGECDHDDERK